MSTLLPRAVAEPVRNRGRCDCWRGALTCLLIHAFAPGCSKQDGYPIPSGVPPAEAGTSDASLDGDPARHRTVDASTTSDGSRTLEGGGPVRIAPTPTFAPVFSPVTGDLMSVSSPSLADLNGDGALDIIFGTGVERLPPYEEPEVSGYVVAISGATNDILWRVPNPTDAFTTPRFSDLDGDGVPDVVMGGREGALSAFSGRNGSLLWRVPPGEVAETPFPYNFFTPALLTDVSGDGVPDLLVTYGGDDTKGADEPRDPGYIAIISGADGAVLAAHPTPDGSETYASPVVYARSDGADWVVFGTGGETHRGSAYRAPVASLLDDTFQAQIETLVPPGTAKGVIAPATLADLTGDGELDIVVSTFDGRLIALAGASGQTLWENQGDGEETYHPAAVVRLPPDGRLGLFVSRGLGTFPQYRGSIHRLIDGRNGRTLYEYDDDRWPAGAPLAVDLTGDGFDELFFFSMQFMSGLGGRIHLLHLASGELVFHDVSASLASTPAIADPRGAGALELIGLSFSGYDPPTPDWNTVEWQLLRLDVTAATPPVRSWAGYMGTNTDGRYPPVTPSDGR